MDQKDVAAVQILSYDLSKAFDKVSFDFIIQRLLSSNVFPAQSLRWLQSYLYDRKQCLRIGTVSSRPLPITSGVPQGSSLGPYLFAASVGEFTLTENCVSHLIKYADDFVICSPLFKNSQNLHVQESHNRLIQWTSATSLTVNIDKCKSLVISSALNCIPINVDGVGFIDKLKILGVYFNNKLSWKDHINSVVSSASKSLFLFRLLRKYFTKQELISVYFASIRSRFEYCAPLFLQLSRSDADCLQKLQNRFHKVICGRFCLKHCLPPLKDRRQFLALKFLTKIRQPTHLLFSLLPPVSGRGRFLLPKRSTQRRSNTFLLSVCKFYNSLHRRKL